jgi:hypothetical protein
MKKLLIILLFFCHQALAQTAPASARGKTAMQNNRLCYWNGNIWVPVADSSAVTGGAVAWGAIAGTLSNQTDLQTALNAKQATITNGSISNAMIISVDAMKLTAVSGATLATSGGQTVTMGTNGIYTCTPTGACTFNASGGTAGQRVTFIFTTSGVSSFVMTFGSSFKSAGTLSTGTTTAKTFCVSFLCSTNGNWVETGRTAAQ